MHKLSTEDFFQRRYSQRITNTLLSCIYVYITRSCILIILDGGDSLPKDEAGNWKVK